MAKSAPKSKKEAIAGDSLGKDKVKNGAKVEKPAGGKLEKTAKAPAASKVAKEPKPPREKKPDSEKTGVVDRSKYDYVTTKDAKTASGRASVDNGDPLATALRSKTAEQVIGLVKDNGGEVNPKWETLNPGLQRMAAGNVMRKLAKRPEGVRIDGKKLAIAA